MASNLYRLVYCSRNRMLGTEAELNDEIRQILTKSRTNNSGNGVTGALLYNDGNFAQVLEGPLPEVEKTFERIQCDPRHSEVTVVESGPVETREFSDWSMALAGMSAATQRPQAEAAFGAVFSKEENAGTEMLSVLQGLVVQEDDWILVEA